MDHCQNECFGGGRCGVGLDHPLRRFRRHHRGCLCHDCRDVDARRHGHGLGAGRAYLVAAQLALQLPYWLRLGFAIAFGLFCFIADVMGLKGTLAWLDAAASAALGLSYVPRYKIMQFCAS